MIYLDQVFYESLRLHSPITSTSRVCSDTIGIEFEGKRVSIEKGIQVTVPIMQIHRDIDIFMEPERFHPERFDYTLKSSIDECLLIPFGAGPRYNFLTTILSLIENLNINYFRSCLGQQFGAQICKFSLAMIVKNFKISVNKKTLDSNFVINPNEQNNIKLGGIWLNFQNK
jgi:cytochrome P450